MFTSLGAKFKEIDEYWDRENQYIKDSGIYTPEEVEQILASHEEIRRNQREEASKKFSEEVQRYRDEHAQQVLDMDGFIDPDDFDYDAEFDYDSNDAYDYDMLRAMKEERDAYDDFVASLDMND